jgi:hypothetical protein
MRRFFYARLVCRCLFELARYDAVYKVKGFPGVPGSIAIPVHTTDQFREEREAAICSAALLACCLYWKPVTCLQRAICLVRLLRSHRIPARLVIGYRVAPFFSHAWVEVDGRVVNDSPVYRQRLRVLHAS